MKSLFALFFALGVSLIICTQTSGQVEVNSGSIDEKVTIARACNISESFCLNRVLLIRGRITNNTLATLSELYNQSDFQEPEAICFDSIGGDNHAAERLIYVIKGSEVKTCLAEKYILSDATLIEGVKCNSACPFIFLSGNKRLALGSEFDVGIHHSGFTFNFCFFKCYFNVGGEEFEQYFTREEHKKFFTDSRKVDYEYVRYLPFKELEGYAFFTQKF